MLITASNEDNMVLMPRYPDKYFDIGIVDGPYGIDGSSHRKNKSRGKLAKATDYHNALWSQPVMDDKFFEELFRVTKEQIIFGANYYPQITTVHKTPRRGEIQQWISEHPIGWIIWDKVNGDVSYNDYELAWTSFDIPTYFYSFMWSGMMQGKSIFNGQTMQGNKSLNQKRIHPTEKPIALYKFLLSKYSTPGKMNLDTHGGSLSNAIAHYDFGCNLVVCEKEPKYFKDGMLRFNNHISQTKIQF